MSATAPTTPTYRGLLVANSVFPRDPHNLPALEGPRNDPALLRAALSHDATGLFPEDNIRLVTERDMAEVLGEVEDFLSSARRDDMVLLYYSGHGTLDQTGEFYLCARDTRVDRLRSTAVKASDVSEMIAQSAARSTIVLLDCCHSGRFKAATAAAQDRLAGRGRFVITSSRGTELANDTDAVNRASLFTHHLVEGLRHGALDGDGDGIVDLSELYDYVHGELGTGGKPVPQKRFEGDGDVPIALRVPRLAIPDPPVVLAREPELDLSDNVIDLGTVVEGEPLPPERVSVVNRGGGTLEWTVESGSPWVRAVRSGNDILLEPAPTRGSSRANVHVRDLRTGAVRTLRIMVRVTAPAPPDPHPVPPPPVPPSPVPTAPVGSPAPAPAVGAGG